MTYDSNFTLGNPYSEWRGVAFVRCTVAKNPRKSANVTNFQSNSCCFYLYTVLHYVIIINIIIVRGFILV